MWEFQNWFQIFSISSRSRVIQLQSWSCVHSASTYWPQLQTFSIFLSAPISRKWQCWMQSSFLRSLLSVDTDNGGSGARWVQSWLTAATLSFPGKQCCLVGRQCCLVGRQCCLAGMDCCLEGKHCCLAGNHFCLVGRRGHCLAGLGKYRIWCGVRWPTQVWQTVDWPTANWPTEQLTDRTGVNWLTVYNWLTACL